jgi:hypothetical protein
MERKKIVPKITLNAQQQEEALREVQKEDKKKTVQRVTIDLPQFIYEQIKQETEDTGQTLKGFVLGLVREHFIRKEAK